VTIHSSPLAAAQARATMEDPGKDAAALVAQAVVRLQIEAAISEQQGQDSEAPGNTTDESGWSAESEDEFLDADLPWPGMGPRAASSSPGFVSARASLSESPAAEGGDASSVAAAVEETEETIRARALKQVNFYFGDRSYPKDKFLRKHARADPVGGYVSLALVAGYKKMKKITQDIALLATALDVSDVVELNAARTMIRRRYPPPKTPAGRLEATVVVENLASAVNEASVRPLFAAVGRVISARRFRPGAEGEEGALPTGLLAELGELPLHPALRAGAQATVFLVELDFPDEAGRACRELNARCVPAGWLLTLRLIRRCRTCRPSVAADRVPFISPSLPSTCHSERRDAPRFTRLYRPGDISGYASPASNPNSPSMRRRNRGRNDDRGGGGDEDRRGRTPSVSPLRSLDGGRHHSPAGRSRGTSLEATRTGIDAARADGAVSRGDGDRAWRDHSQGFVASPLAPGGGRSAGSSPLAERRGGESAVSFPASGCSRLNPNPTKHKQQQHKFTSACPCSPKPVGTRRMALAPRQPPGAAPSIWRRVCIQPARLPSDTPSAAAWRTRRHGHPARKPTHATRQPAAGPPGGGDTHAIWPGRRRLCPRQRWGAALFAFLASFPRASLSSIDCSP